MANSSEYFDYLTKRLDSGESKNIVISTTVEVIGRLLENKKQLRILDAGCFSGAMLNRIFLELSPEQRSRVILIGIDSDTQAMQHGAGKYGNISYIEADFEHKIPLVRQYDVIILCNVLHELFSNYKTKERKTKIRSVYKQIAHLLNKSGEIVLLDGIRPDDASAEIKVELTSSEWRAKFEKMVREYTAAKLRAERVTDKMIRTNRLSLAVFLTKARYLDTDYWESEAAQLYQYFTTSDFEEMVRDAGVQLKKLEPQVLSRDKAGEVINEISPKIELPAKNVLVVAANN